MNLRSKEEVAYARQAIARNDPGATKYLASVLSQADRWMKYSDAALRDMVPPANIPRAFNAHFKEDPRNPEKIARYGHYPWIIDPDRPYKLISPVDGFVYPTNDFDPKNPGGPEDVSTEPYVDTGWGWKDPNDPQKYWFVAYYAHWLWLSYLVPATLSLGEAYLLTGNLAYAQKAVALLDRIAEVYPEMDYVKQSRYGTEIQPGNYHGRIVNAIWETGVVRTLATAYDYVFEAMPHLTDLTKATGKTVEAVRDNIEQNLLEEAARSIYTLDRRIVGNFGMHHSALATMAVVLDNENTDKYLDWVLNTTGNGSWQYEGILTGLTNFIFRDGAPNESSPGYNSLWVSHFQTVAELMLRRGVNLYESEPKLKKLFDYPLRLLMNEKFVPNIGDTGSVKSSGPVGFNGDVYATAFRRYGDINYGRVLWQTGLSSGGVYEESILSQALQRLRDEGYSFSYKSDLFPAHGLALLRTGHNGRGAGVSLYYGPAGGHGHYDRLNIEIFAKGYRLTPDLGYPEYMTSQHKKLYGWINHTISHNTVMVDAKRQMTKDGGRLQAFASSPTVQYVEARAEEAYPGVVDRYQRSVALIDLSDTDAYVVDVFRVKGGNQHDYSFHGPDGTFEALGLSLSEVQSKGSLAGEDVPFATLYDAPSLERPGYTGSYSSYTGSGFGYLKNVQRGRTESPWTAEWVTRDFPQVTLRATFLPEPGTEVIVADGEPPTHVSTNPETLKYVLQRRTAPAGQAAESPFVSVIQPFSGRTPLVQEARRLAAEDPSLVALELRRPDGIDYVFQALDVERLHTVHAPDAKGSMQFQGRLGVISREADGTLRHAYLLGGGRLEDGDLTIEAAGSYTGEVVGLDAPNRRVRVKLDANAAELPVGELLAGERLVIHNDKHATEYQVVRVAHVGAGEYELTLGDTDFLTGKGKVLFTRSRGETTYLGTSTPLMLTKYYEGQWVIDPVTGQGARLKAVAGSTLELAGTLALEKDREFHIYDFGPGDRFILTSAVHVEKDLRGGYQVITNVPVSVTVAGEEQVRFSRL